MKEKVLEALRTLGCEPKNLSFCYGFDYEDMHYLFLPNDNDENFLSFALPGVLKFEDENPLPTYKLMDKLNSSVKYVKATNLDGNAWLFYERELLGNEEMEEVVAAMIYSLESARIWLYTKMQEDDDKNNEDEENKENDENEENKEE